MEKYPIFTAPDNVWDNIQSRIHNKNKYKKHNIFSRFLYYKKISIGIGTCAILFMIVGIFYNRQSINQYDINNSNYLLYVDEAYSLTNDMQENLEIQIQQLNQL